MRRQELGEASGRDLGDRIGATLGGQPVNRFVVSKAVEIDGDAGDSQAGLPGA